MDSKYYRTIYIHTKDHKEIPCYLYALYSSSFVIKAMVDDLGADMDFIYLDIDYETMLLIFNEIDRYGPKYKELTRYSPKVLYTILEADHKYEFGLLEKYKERIFTYQMSYGMYRILVDFCLLKDDHLKECWNMIFHTKGPLDYIENKYLDILYPALTDKVICSIFRAQKQNIEKLIEYTNMVMATLPRFVTHLASMPRMSKHKPITNVINIITVKYTTEPHVMQFWKHRAFNQLNETDSATYAAFMAPNE
jgi:hypothetical protein